MGQRCAEQSSRDSLTCDVEPVSARLVGAVLEEVCGNRVDAKDSPLTRKPGVDRLNVALAKARIYDKLVQKRITAIARK
jgi:hypothetical protein